MESCDLCAANFRASPCIFALFYPIGASKPAQQQAMEKNISELWDPANHCFVCGPSNPGGLRVRFRLEDSGGEPVCRAAFTPGPTHVGYSDMLHGGILYCLLDDVMANWGFLQGLRVHTARCEVRYRDAVPMDVGLRLEGRLLRRRGRMLEMEGKAFRNDNGALAATARARFMEARPGAHPPGFAGGAGRFEAGSMARRGAPDASNEPAPDER